MAVRDKATLEASLASMFATNGLGDISAADFRSFFDDMLDSLQFSADAVALQDVLDEIKAGQHIDIDRTVNGEITIDYDPGGNVGTHTRYALLTASASTPSAGDFLTGFTSQTDEITVDAYTTAMFLHFADFHDQLGTIQQTASQFNGRMGFSANPTALMISSQQYYVYSSVAARNPVGQRTWRLQP